MKVERPQNTAFPSNNAEIQKRHSKQAPMPIHCIFTILFMFTKSKVGHISCHLK